MRIKKNLGILAFVTGMCLGGCSFKERHLESLALDFPETKTFQEAFRREKIPFVHCSDYLLPGISRFVYLDIYESSDAFSNIIFLPTFGEPANSLSYFSREMASYGHNVYVLDVEGFGNSSGIRGEINLDKIGEDISKTIEYVKKRNNKKIVLGGSSIGAEFSLLYAVEGKHKKDINALIIHGCYIPSLEGIESDYRVDFSKNKFGRFLIKLFAGNHLNKVKHLGKENFYNGEGKFEQIATDLNYVTHACTLSYLNFLDYEPRVPVTSFEEPILFIISKDDRIVSPQRSREAFEIFKEKNPWVKLYTPSGRDNDGIVPHLAFDTNYGEISERINFFLRTRL